MGTYSTAHQKQKTAYSSAIKLDEYFPCLSFDIKAGKQCLTVVSTVIICYTYQEINPLEEEEKKNRNDRISYFQEAASHTFCYTVEKSASVFWCGHCIYLSWIPKLEAFQVADLFFSWNLEESAWNTFHLHHHKSTTWTERLIIWYYAKNVNNWV